VPQSPLTATVTPTGHVRLVDDDDEAPALTGAAIRIARRLLEAFDGGDGPGLLHLGTAEPATALPPSLAFWRDFAGRWTAALCRQPDLDTATTLPPLPAPPADELAALVDAAPPMVGGEYLTADVLTAAWYSIHEAAAIETRSAPSVAAWLHDRSDVWHTVGRVHFHLAENKRTPATPFAFLATYTTDVGRSGEARHLPLGRALEHYAGKQAKDELLSLLRPVHDAAERSDLVRRLVDDRSIFHPLAWTAGQAYGFLKDLPAVEAAGVIVKIPDWWRSPASRRPTLQLTVGGTAPPLLGLDALMDFRVDAALGDEAVTRQELEALLASTEGLALLKGRWVEVDRDRVARLLEVWDELTEAAAEGVSLAEGLRLMAGAELDGSPLTSLAGTGWDDDGVEEGGSAWLRAVPGPWLTETLRELREPSRGRLDFGGRLRTKLRPYQEAGVVWLETLRRLGVGGCLADDMGLGKTVQVIALLLLEQRRTGAGERRPHLLVVPASLVANWKAELERFAPSLSVLVAHGSERPTKELQHLTDDELTRCDVVVTTYALLHRLPFLTERTWDVVVLDEAQAIKSPGAKQTRAAKSLRGRTRLALTGTPVENRLGDLWSLFDFVNPGLLGNARTFGLFAKGLNRDGRPDYRPLRRLVRPYILRRLKSDRSVIDDLPDKTEMSAFCTLTKRQAALYAASVNELQRVLTETAEASDPIKRRGLVLAFLTRFKQICDHPSLWLGDGAFAEADSGKFARLREICDTVAARQEKMLVFSQYRAMTEPLAAFLGSVFGREGLVLDGGTPVKRRRDLVDRFQTDERIPFFVVSLRAGGTGLNLTAASHVVHFDRWWNPAVENQATDRAYRIGQHKNVLVHKFVCQGTVEEKVDRMLADKQRMADEILAGGGEMPLTELSDDDLLRLVALDITRAGGQN